VWTCGSWCCNRTLASKGTVPSPGCFRLQQGEVFGDGFVGNLSLAVGLGVSGSGFQVHGPNVLDLVFLQSSTDS